MLSGSSVRDDASFGRLGSSRSSTCSLRRFARSASLSILIAVEDAGTKTVGVASCLKSTSSPFGFLMIIAALGLLGFGIGVGTKGAASACSVDFKTGGRGGGYAGRGGSIGMFGKPVSPLVESLSLGRDLLRDFDSVSTGGVDVETGGAGFEKVKSEFHLGVVGVGKP